MERAGKFACGHNHVLQAWDQSGRPVDLTGYFCLVCLGKVISAEELIDLRILAPQQAPIGNWSGEVQRG